MPLKGKFNVPHSFLEMRGTYSMQGHEEKHSVGHKAERNMGKTQARGFFRVFVEKAGGTV